MPLADIVNPLLPVGSGMLWFTNTAPSGWLLCQGQSLLRTAFPALFAVIGTTYGAVDGTHFTLPDLRGRFPLGQNPLALAVVGGAMGHTHTGPSHTHTGPSHTHTSAAHDHTVTPGDTANGVHAHVTAGNEIEMIVQVVHSWTSGVRRTWSTPSGVGNTSFTTGVEVHGVTDSTTPGATGAGGTGATGAGGTGATGTADPPYQVVNFAIKAF